MKRYLKQSLLVATGLTLVVALVGCSDSDSSTQAGYQVTLTNLTAHQPMAPLAAILHNQNYVAWQIGAAVGDGLEQLAEGGDPSAFIAEAGTSTGVRDSKGGSGVVPPGGSETLTLSGALSGAQLSVASMLVNTNDAFTGTSGQSIDNLQIGESMTIDINSYDAGTEANSETAASIPGPAGGGEGYNVARDDRDFVTSHPGVVSADDGLTTSALDESHRIQNPAARLVITRIQ